MYVWLAICTRRAQLESVLVMGFLCTVSTLISAALDLCMVRMLGVA